MSKILLSTAIALLSVSGLSHSASAQITGQVTGQITGQITGQPELGIPAQTPVQASPAPRSLGPSSFGQSLGLPAAANSNATYILGAGDQISLSVIGYPEFTGTVAILPDGSVTLPLIGPVRVSGLTPNQLSVALTQQLSTYLVEPAVNVGLAVMRPVVVTVSGEVHRPGPVQMSSLSDSNTEPLGRQLSLEGEESQIARVQLSNRSALPTLSSAVILAGGVTRDADIRQVSVRRPVPGGRTEVLTLDLWEAITSNVGVADIGLRDGDSIYIPALSGDEIDRRIVANSSLAPSTVRVRLVGDVKEPGEVAVPPDSTVSSAVAIAGGPTTDAQLGNVSLVRQNENGEIEETEIDLANLTDDYQIQDGDVVVVAKKGYLSVTDGLARVLNPLNIFRLFGF